MGCPDINDPNASWNFCPNLGASIFFALLFAATTGVHIAQAIIHRKAYCWVITMGALWQTATYILHSLSIQHPTVQGYYIAWFVLILLAPLWTNAFVYMVLGRMVWNFAPRPQIWGVKAWRTSLYFVLLDITAFIIQAVGAATASGNNTSEKTKKTGLDIYMAGVGFQQLFVLLFIVLTIMFQRELARKGAAYRMPGVLRLLYVLYAVLGLITLRIIFRLVEYSSGFNSSIPNHEAYQYCLDSLPMFVALVLFNIYHPGRIMPGKESDLPSRKERKQLNYAKSSDGGVSEFLSPGQKLSRPYQLNHLNDAEYPERTVFAAKSDSEAIPTHGYVS